MIVKTYKTHKIIPGDDIYKILDKYLPKLEEKSVVVITSKIISICQGRVVENNGKVSKKALSEKESDLYLKDSRYYKKFKIVLTIKNNLLIANSGIDESNANGYFVLWPSNLFNTTAKIWKYLKNKNKIHNLGIIITDSHIHPQRWGVTGVGLSWCGFRSLNSYIGKPDLFNRKLIYTNTSVVDGLSAAAVVVMGEGNEQTPLAVISGLPFVKFLSRPPSPKEIDSLKIPLKDDMYAPLLTSVNWQKSGNKS